MLNAARSSKWLSPGSPGFTCLSGAPKSIRRGYASVTALENFPKPGEQLHGFTLLRSKHVPELELTALHLQHDKTGADYLHIARDDKNNVFSIGFKTNPPDDTGVPHILEHTTLCGSEKYPIRDPFFKMLPRSLSNFMNAFTSSDHTTYPFATTNQQDFKNLMSVYLDATLHPLLKAEDFTQEGWRIGPENPLAAATEDGKDAADNRLVFKGVVYNEMKGQMSDAGYLYYIRFQDHLFPAINNSGGDPQKMTDLTYEELKRFHEEHYHPSNAKLFTYGDIPLAEHLKDVSSRLEKFSRIMPDKDIKIPIDLSGGRQSITIKGPLDPLVSADSQYKTSTSWLMGETSDVQEMFALGVLSNLLMDGYGSPLYKALIEPGLGSDFSPNTGFDSSGQIAVFSVGLSGVKQTDVLKVQDAIYSTLKSTKTNGFEKVKVDGILHQLELALKHKTANFGMGVMQRLKPGWFNGVDPFDALAWRETVDSFKANYAKGGYLEGLLEKYFLNDKTLTFTMEPSELYSQEIADEEASRLASKILDTAKQYSKEEEVRQSLEKRELDLLEVQENARNQDLSCLPSVHVRDIPRQKETKETRDGSIGEVKVQWREVPTNGLTYFRAVNIFHQLPDGLRELIPLFCDAIMRIGTKDMTMEQIEGQIKLKTGGVNVGYHSTTSPLVLDQCEEGLALSGYALDQNIPEMYQLLRMIIQETDFDGAEAERNIRQLLQTTAGGATDNIASSGHSFARRFAESGLTPQGRLAEQIAGLTQVKLTTSLASRAEDEGLADVIDNLKKIQRFALSNGNTFRAALTCSPGSATENENNLSNWLPTLLNTSAKPAPNSQPTNFLRNSKSFFPLPYQVYYSALSMRTAPYTSPDSAPLAILAQLLTHRHLHHEIREKGGAYGGGAYSRGLGGVFGYYSYRDPNPQNTLKVMSKAGMWARDKQWTSQDIEEAKLSVFQGVDAPESVSQEGMTRFLSGVDEAMQQRKREQLLDVGKEQIRDVAQRYLVEQAKNSSIAILGQKSDWVKETDGWQLRDLGMKSLEEVGTLQEGQP
ncbi:MAG: Mitochondrial presequence protease [Bogoriella megaspora]|nr:MAG: Mitochondrial presequence protease [Bogoriella megaspora]